MQTCAPHATLKSAAILIGALTTFVDARAEETALSKSCIFAAAAQLPPVPGLVIKSASSAPARVIQVGGTDPTMHQWTVTLTIEAAGQTAVYETLCRAGDKTPATVAEMTIREPAFSPGETQHGACPPECKPSAPEQPQKK